MPTPFTHLAYAQRLLQDETLPPQVSTLIQAQRPAFLLGSVAADAQTIVGIPRQDTHFYSYERKMENHPFQVMLTRFPTLQHPKTDAQRAFVGGYAAHLAMDEIWTLKMLIPHFVQREWGNRSQRFLSLHLLLISMDERDEKQLAAFIAADLECAIPQAWLPFMSDDTLCEWREIIYRQIAPGGASETLDVIAPRVMQSKESLRALLDSPSVMERDLWQHIPHELLAEVEADMLSTAREQMISYLR